MHVGFISFEYPYSNNTSPIGGIGTFTKNLAEELVQQNTQVTVFLANQDKHSVFIENGVTIHQVLRKEVKFFTWLSNRMYFNSYVKKVIHDSKINVIETPDWTGFTALMSFNIPVVLRLHGSDTFFSNLEGRKVKFKNNFFEKNALKRADKIVGVSQFVADKTKELFKLKTNIEIIYNTINTGDFLPNHKSIQSKQLLYFGAIIRKKGVLEIAKTFNLLVEKDENIKLTFLGRDTIDVFEKKSTLSLFKSMLSKKAVAGFKYIPSVPYHQVKQYIYSAEVILLPSFAEAFPMTWLEAMAMEKKLVTSNVGWANELMINNETGYCINPKDHFEFSESVLNLLNNEVKARQMSINARNRIKEVFNYNNILKQNINLYRKLS